MSEIQLDELADSFEEIWLSGDRPSLQSFLNRVAPDLKSRLAELLIPVDIEYRIKRGETVLADDYQNVGDFGESNPEHWTVFPGRGIFYRNVGDFGKSIAEQALAELKVPSDDVDATLDNALNQKQSADESQFFLVETEPEFSTTANRPKDIGPYRLLQKLAEGGMGEVWIAEQEAPVRRRVALKLIKSGFGSKEIIARFEAERQALALMNHPNIARILDAGTTDQGQPYFVMELVTGKPLTTYCDENKLSIDERLKIFTDVCAGVQHAHQKGIIHRDLKPGNIIVGIQDGQAVPKVIDFGLAKAMESTQRLTDQSLFTGVGQVLGTLKYMSPEQASIDNLDIDTRTDIYALGVILYELLTGSTPLDDPSVKGQAVLKVLEFIREKEPVKPSSKLGSSTDEQISSITGQRQTDSVRLKRILLGDLDWIVMKALEKDRTRRYESASGFAADIRRYLDSEPVVARPPSVNYRIRKFVRKNRVGVIAALLVTMALAGGLVGTTSAMFRALNAEALAENRLVEVEIAREQELEQRKLAEEREAEAIKQKTRAETREQEAINAVRRFGDAVGNNVELKNNPALDSLRKSLLQEPFTFFKSLREQLESDADTRPESLVQLAFVASNLGALTAEIGNKQDALSAFEQALEIRQQLASGNPNDVEIQHALAKCYVGIGDLLSDTGRPAEALKAYEQAQQIQERLVLVKPDVPDFQNSLSASYNNIGILLSETGEHERALTAYERAREIRETLVRENPSAPEFQNHLGASLNNIGLLLNTIGQLDDALRTFQRALEIKQTLAQDHPTIAEFQSSLADSHLAIGNFLLATGKPTEALDAYNSALAINKKLVNDHPTVTEYQSDLAAIHNNIAVVLSATGKTTEALQSHERSREIREKLARDNPSVLAFQNALAASHNGIGNLLWKISRPDEALEAYEQARDIRQRLARENPMVTDFQSDLAATYNSIGLLQKNVGKFVEAVQSYEQALEIRKALAQDNPTVPDFQYRLAASQVNLGSLLSDTGKPVEALEAFEKARDTLTVLAQDHPTVTMYQNALANNLNSMGMLLGGIGKPIEALRVYEQALKIREKLVHDNLTIPEFKSNLGGTLNNIAMVQIDLSNFEEAHETILVAIAHQQEAHEISPANPTYRRFLRNHYLQMTRAATGLGDEELLREAKQNRAKLAISDPANEPLNLRLKEVEIDSGITAADELLQLARFSYETMRFAQASRLFSLVMENDPTLIGDRNNQLAFAAASCALLAAADESIQEAPLDDKGKADLRDKALAWLEDELDRWEKAVVDQPDQIELASETFRYWLVDPNLRLIRDSELLQTFPESERIAWENLWIRVRANLKKLTSADQNHQDEESFDK